MRAIGISNRGKVRPNNEDRYLIIGEEPIQVFAVADGMGGHAAGEVASSMALDVIHSYLGTHQHDLVAKAAGNKTLHPYLEDMLDLSNEMVLVAGNEKPEYNGMGTTLTMVLSVLGQCWLAHIGDSRAYLIRNNSLTLLTEDHTLVYQLVKNGQISKKESNDHPQRHILTRALGTDESADFDIMPIDIQQGDRLLLCTDGLHGLVSDEEILSIAGQKTEPGDILEQLVTAANEKGGIDNITIVYIEQV